MQYDEAVRVLEGALKFGIDPSLEPVRAICRAMGNPQKSYQCIQVAGTNGKTSTTRMIAALLHAQGKHVGLYVSPHLVRYPERMEIDGRVVDDQTFAEAIKTALEAAKSVGIAATEFELLTAAALWLFSRENVEWAVFECGMGGRWDATSVVDPCVAVITGVALEHTEILGDTIEKIADEKAAIVKQNSTAVLAQGVPAHEIFERRAIQVGAPLIHVDSNILLEYDAALRHFPAYQRSNASTAITAAEEALGYELDSSDVLRAMEALTIPGRFEILHENPLVIIDAAHNPQSAKTLAQEIESCFMVRSISDSQSEAARIGERERIPTLLLGVLADKDVREIVRTLCPLFFRVVVTASSSSRSVPAEELARIVEEETGIVPEVAPSILQAKQLLFDEPIIATGSITVAGEVKAIWC